MKNLLTVFIFFTTLCPHTIAAQTVTNEEEAVLGKPVKIQADNLEIKKVLSEIQDQTGVKFVFSSKAINASRKISCKLPNHLLADFLVQVLKPLDIHYKVIDERRILLFSPEPATALYTSTTDTSAIETPVSYTVREIVITGTVKNQDGSPMEGVTVNLKGTTTSVLTDQNGRFSITVNNKNDVLVFSNVGYTTQEKNAGDFSVIDVIVLKEKAEALDDIVVIGYGTVKKRDATGSVASVKIADLQRAPVRSLEEALAGRVAGVQVSSADGQPGDGLNITIRGSNSVTGSNTPLFVIDGFPVENQNNNTINPAEIESIDVLKDASAIAMYGSRAANGVIIITTKRGIMGKPTVNYNAYYGFSAVNKKLDLMGPYDFIKIQTEIDPVAAAAAYFTNGKTLESYRNAKGLDFQNQLYRPAPFQNHYLSVAGGDKDSKYTFSGSYTKQDGIIINSGFKRGQVRLVYDKKINNRLRFGINTNYTSSRSYGTIPRNQSELLPGTVQGNDVAYQLLYNVWTYRPITGRDSLNDDLEENLIDPEQDILTDARVNPIFSAQNEYNARINNTIVSNFFTEFDVTKDLKFRINAGTVMGKDRNEIFNNSLTRAGSPLTRQGQTNGINGSINYFENNSYLGETQLTYTKKFNKHHNLTAVAVYSYQYNNSKNHGFTASKVPNEVLGISGLDEGIAARLNARASSNKLGSYLGRINYTLFNKYLFTVSMRADGSSKFASNKRFGYFPTGAFAWKISEENFMQSISVISNAKLRVSYGLVGNNRVGSNDYVYLSQIFSNANNSYYPFGNNLTQVFNIVNLGNPELKWESTSMMNAGLEIGFFQNRITLEADYYKKRTSDLLLLASLPANTGFSNVIRNIGKTENEGFEFALTTVNIEAKNFKWTSAFNISFNRNKIVALNGEVDNLTNTVSGSGIGFTNLVGYIAKVGQPISQFYGFVADGNYQYSDFDQLPNGTWVLKHNVPHSGGIINVSRGNQQPGDPKYKDINGDGLINNDDLTVIGDPNPIHFGGFNNNFRYKNFDLNIFMQWSYGNEVYNANRYYLENAFRLNFNLLTSYNNHWTPNNPTNGNPRVNAQGITVYTSRFVEDASFLRLKTVQLGYNINAGFLRKAHIQSVRAYISAQNLYTWTKYTGSDPEVSTKGNGLTAGYDFSAYPASRTCVAGIDITF